MIHKICLTQTIELGSKTVPPGIILQLDRASMKKLVEEQKAFWCTNKGRRIKYEEE